MAEVVATKLVEEVVCSLLTKVKKEIRYMWGSKDNIEKLRNEAEKLKNMKERVEQKIRLALDNGDELVAGVEKWVNEADDHITTAEGFLQEEADAKKTCFNLRMCVNLSTLHHYGKEATNKVRFVEQHQIDGKDYEGDVSVPTASPGILELYPRENIDDLDTHKSLLEKIIESVNSTQITGIWGIGGVGKTTLATKVVARVKHLFDLVVSVTVSRTVDAKKIEKIQKKLEIAAKRIRKREKVLIILDDVWTKVKLHEVGIPCVKDFPGCKILLTSRKRKVCSAMDALTPIYVDCLKVKEAWALFKRVVGERVETDANLQKVEEDIVKGCGGLPLILQAVGKALKGKENIEAWKKARDSIKKHKTLDIDEDVKVEFAHLRLSYDYLENEEAKSIFLLCSMFPEDFEIRLEQLAYYGGCKDLDRLEDTRNKVHSAVEILKSSCLLLDGCYEYTTKMHDVVREVALLIASQDDNKFLVEAGENLKEWLPRSGSLSYTGISLMENDICKLPAGYKLNIPSLQIFLIQENRRLSEISDEFIQALGTDLVYNYGGPVPPTASRKS